MFPSEQLLKNKRLLTSFQQGVIELFKKYGHQLTIKDVAVVSESVPWSTTTVCLTRMIVNRTGIAYPITSTDAQLREKISDLIMTSEAAPKSIEAELGKIYTAALEEEFKANLITSDPKATLVVPDKALLCWKDLQVLQAIRFKFDGPKGEMIFELPYMDQAMQTEKVVELTGFSPKSRILVVDDSSTSRKLSRHCLSLAGLIQIEECEDGQVALTKITSTSPTFDLVIADWHMPNMTGMDLLKSVRKLPQFKAIPIVFATGERNLSEVTNAIKEGVNGYIVKPLEPEAVFKAIKKAAPKLEARKKAG